jgi:hypothetical protein
MTVFYVCSFGGCGSTALARHLGNFGERVYHVHSRCPPRQLTEVDVFTESFTNKPATGDVRVIFVFRDPVQAILSRFALPQHIAHIEAAPATIEEVVRTGEDLFRLTEFFRNYMYTPRNYPIVFVKYEALFTHLPLLHKLLGIKTILTIPRKETPHSRPDESALRSIYAPLSNEMKTCPPLFIR